MAYSVASKKTGQTYYLHSKEVTLRGGRKQVIYFFARDERAEAVNELPSGYIVMENSRTGLPMLKKA
jgi:YHS domain-containing protein